jgi:hypothetical protein
MYETFRWGSTAPLFIHHATASLNARDQTPYQGDLAIILAKERPPPVHPPLLQPAPESTTEDPA